MTIVLYCNTDSDRKDISLCYKIKFISRKVKIILMNRTLRSIFCCVECECSLKEKGKVVPTHLMEEYKRIRGISPSILNLGSR